MFMWENWLLNEILRVYMVDMRPGGMILSGMKNGFGSIPWLLLHGNQSLHDSPTSGKNSKPKL